MQLYRILPLLLLPAAAAVAQPALDGEPARIFHFAHAGSPQQRQEILNAIRIIGEIQRSTTDDAAGALVVRGTPAQVELAAWVFGELDRAPGQPAATAVESYHYSGEAAPEARAFFLAHFAAPQPIQELVNTLRSVAELNRVVAYMSNSAVLVRGGPAQVDLAAWIVHNLDQPAGVLRDAKPLEYTYPDSSSRPATAVRMFHLSHAVTPKAIEDLIDAVRSIAEVQRITMDSATSTVTLRATPEQAALATWLIQELDRAPASRVEK